MWRWGLTDPALIRVWPKKWLTDPEIAPTIRYLDRYLHDFQRTTETNITTTVNRDAYDSTIGMVFGQPGVEAQKQIDPYSDALVGKAFEETGQNDYTDQIVYVKEIVCKTVGVGGTITASDDMLITMENNSTMYLPENPRENSVVYMTKTSGKATVKGNGKKINGRSNDYVFYKLDLARQFHYVIDRDEWRII